MSTPAPPPIKPGSPPRNRPATRTGPPLTVGGAATYLGVSERLVRKLVTERRIAHHKIGRLVRLTPADLDAYLASCRVPAVNPWGRSR